MEDTGTVGKGGRGQGRETVVFLGVARVSSHLDHLSQKILLGFRSYFKDSVNLSARVQGQEFFNPDKRL